ncbi:MAG: hypothetical protein OEO20_04315 [Gemmatimonadota bacterium]|nr:hypothetical protein [Gemmatimonadota bacterium]MDH3367821.1 hypothetical protein [Gemmatimonadota bacterium]MDH3477511.1 hypothetical protein [Gemmatimonadota bacterium]MDH3569006.1 hypothetical protein [Gemmatimonadota bacterium]MDH5549154.1 hypothetical protein [Gemmatimonadota bacterium]
MSDRVLTEHDYREIDPRDKRIWLIVFGVLGVGLAALWGLNAIVQDHAAELQSLAESDPDAARRQAAASLRAVLSVITLLNVLVAAFLAWQGMRSLSTGRSPPPGSWIIRGRPVYTGRTAIRVGRILIAAAILLAVATLVMLWLGWGLTAQ